VGLSALGAAGADRIVLRIWIEVETRYFEGPSVDDHGRSQIVRGHVEHYWLCDQCAAHIALRFDRERGVVTVSSQEGAGQTMVTATLQANPPVVTGVSQVLIRTLDRKLDGEAQI